MNKFEVTVWFKNGEYDSEYGKHYDTIQGMNYRDAVNKIDWNEVLAMGEGNRFNGFTIKAIF